MSPAPNMRGQSKPPSIGAFSLPVTVFGLLTKPNDQDNISSVDARESVNRLADSELRENVEDNNSLG
ncbi:MAG: hypothetical protein ACTS6G_05815 [Candidatus Hodgkinia cicadicola]